MTIKVLVIEDSKIFQRVLAKMLATDDDIEIVGIASDPYEARDLIINENPDVCTLDIHLPRMNGLDFLKRLMQYNPIPVVVISSLTHDGSREAMDALSLGAAEVLAKPTSNIPFEESAHELCQAVHAAALAKLNKNKAISQSKPTIKTNGNTYKRNALLCIGASTGGTEAIKEVLLRMPPSIPPTLIAQHMPPVFTKSFAERLDSLTPFKVLEAGDKEVVKANHVYIAPGGYHLKIINQSGKLVTQLDDGPRVHYQRPAVDVLFESIAHAHSGEIASSILTGMGRDGAAGMNHLKQKGAHCIAQNEETCVVYGMPRVVIEQGLADQILPIQEIGAAMLQAVSNTASPLA